MTKPTRQRYAIYYAPQTHSGEWELGSRWLGRCSVTGHVREQPTIEGLTIADFYALTAEPRRYGWHATLKAPFALAEGISEEDLCFAISNLAKSLSAFEMPALKVARLVNFLALTPSGDTTKLTAIANACVTELHHCAAALDEGELLRRRISRLSARQDELLLAWGYPYVFDEFRFHCSLTGPLGQLSQHQFAAVEQAARTFFDALPNWNFESMALFMESAPGAEFMLLKHFKLGT